MKVDTERLRKKVNEYYQDKSDRLTVITTNKEKAIPLHNKIEYEKIDAHTLILEFELLVSRIEELRG